MDAEVALRIIFYFTLLLLSGFFSGSETALFSVSPVHLMRLEEEGHPRLPLLTALLDQPRRLIATIFIGNEFVNIGASALMASLTHAYIGGTSNAAVVAVLSTCISVTLILLLGEITPKNIAAKMEVRWALIATRPIWLLALVMAPLRWTIERIADAVVFIVGGREGRAPAEPVVGEQEFRTMVDVVSRRGDIDQREKELIENIFDFGDRRVREVMTPRDAVFMLPYDLAFTRLLEEVRSSKFSRIPIFKGRRDRIVGVLYAKDLIAVVYGLIERPRRLQELLHQPFFVPRVTKCERLKREFLHRRIHQALVVNEYGELVGLVTMEDLLEEVFGEIRDEKEIPPPVAEDGPTAEAND